MKVTIERVEKLVERADVSYETAKEALEAADGNMLDAVIALEQAGKLGANAGGGRSSSYTTGTSYTPGGSAIGETYGAGSTPQVQIEPNFTMGKEQNTRYQDETTAFEDNAVRFFKWLGRVFRAGVINYFEVWRKGERIIAFPVILFLLCFIPWVFWVVLVLIIIGLCCGSRYSFSGPHLGRKSKGEDDDREDSGN